MPTAVSSNIWRNIKSNLTAKSFYCSRSCSPWTPPKESLLNRHCRTLISLKTPYLHLMFSQDVRFLIPNESSSMKMNLRRKLRRIRHSSTSRQLRRRRHKRRHSRRHPSRAQRRPMARRAPQGATQAPQYSMDKTRGHLTKSPAPQDLVFFKQSTSTPAHGSVTRPTFKAPPSRKALWDIQLRLSTNPIDTETHKHTST